MPRKPKKRPAPASEANRPPGTLAVAIVGGSGSGKSWLAARLRRSLGPRAARLSLDDFYRDRSGLSPARRARLNFDHPRAIDWEEFERVLQALLAGRSAQVPRYDFRTHCRLRGRRTLAPKPVLLVDGLWLLRRPALRRLFGVRLFLDCPTRTRLRRRLARDLATRGRTRSSIAAQFRQTVEPMHCLHVAPQARWADLVLRGNHGLDRVLPLIRAGLNSGYGGLPATASAAAG